MASSRFQAAGRAARTPRDPLDILYLVHYIMAFNNMQDIRAGRAAAALVFFAFLTKNAHELL